MRHIVEIDGKPIAVENLTLDESKKPDGSTDMAMKFDVSMSFEMPERVGQQIWDAIDWHMKLAGTLDDLESAKALVVMLSLRAFHIEAGK